MSFTRTTTGKANEYLFYKDPLVWVEGRTDYCAYKPLSVKEGFLLKVAGGRAECEKLLEAMLRKNHQYVVILDGDYHMLVERGVCDDRVIMLKRHSVENYFFEEQILETICQTFARWSEPSSILGGRFAELVKTIENELTELVVYDVAHWRAGTGIAVMPQAVEAILQGNHVVSFSHSRIAQHLQTAHDAGNADVEDARQCVRDYVSENRLVDVLKGHLVLGILRKFVIEVVSSTRQRKRVPHLDNDNLVMHLAEHAWLSDLSIHHRAFIHDLEQALKLVRAGRAN